MWIRRGDSYSSALLKSVSPCKPDVRDLDKPARRSKRPCVCVFSMRGVAPAAASLSQQQELQRGVHCRRAHLALGKRTMGPPG